MGARARPAAEWLVELCRAVIGPPEAARQRQDVVRRALIAASVVAVLGIQEWRVPGWPGIVAACFCALLYDAVLCYLVYVQRRILLTQVLGVGLDALLLMGASFYVFREMGAASATSDIWLVFLVYIVIGGFTFAPVGSILYTALWIGWFGLATTLYFPEGSHYRDEMFLRLVFLGLIGLVSLGMALELEKRRARLELQNRQTTAMLATLVEARDTDAGAHLQRIQHFSRALALRLGFSQREAQEIAYASMVHDVGKANVPDAILKKTGPLTPEEWRIMQRHTHWGDSLLMNNSDFETARQVARWHHEHWDGTGYPDRLRGEDIPLAARIVAVADVFDALISKRPYKEAWEPETAMVELGRLAGSHLDARLVAAFVELWDEGEIAVITRAIVELDGQNELRSAA
jgi:hypothetical protein